MFFHCDLFLDSDDDSEEEEALISRRRNRDNSDPMSIPNSAFKKLFRVNKEAFVYVLGKIDSQLPSARSTYIPNVLKLCATLRFLAEGGYQRGTGQDFLVGMAQPTLSATIAKMLSVMESVLCPEHISFLMTEDEMSSSKQYFYEKFRFAGIIGSRQVPLSTISCTVDANRISSLNAPSTSTPADDVQIKVDLPPTYEEVMKAFADSKEAAASSQSNDTATHTNNIDIEDPPLPQYSRVQ